MRYRGKFMTEHTGIIFPKEVAERYIDDYYIFQDSDNNYYINISSKTEMKDHTDILNDIMRVLKHETVDYYAIILWEEGAIDRFNLITGDWNYMNEGN